MAKTKTRSATLPVDAAPHEQAPPAVHANVYSTIGLVVGTAATAQGSMVTACLVTYPENPSREARPALVLNHVPAVVPGQSVLLHFVAGDSTRPVVLGVVASQGATEIGGSSPPLPLTAPDLSGVRVELESQETLTLMATKQLVLRCGQASIVLQEDGKIEIRGTDVISRASGQNAVRGASVTLN